MVQICVMNEPYSFIDQKRKHDLKGIDKFQASHWSIINNSKAKDLQKLQKD